jgi:hypothetical protein
MELTPCKFRVNLGHYRSAGSTFFPSQITALKDHLAHTEAQLAAEKERSFSCYQALQSAKESLERDRDARQTAVKRAAAALTKLDQEEAHWRHVDGVNKSLKEDLEKVRARLEVLAGVEKEKALLEERLGGERQRRERAEGAVQGLEGEKERMKAELERFKGLEVALREGEEMRDGLQVGQRRGCLLAILVPEARPLCFPLLIALWLFVSHIPKNDAETSRTRTKSCCQNAKRMHWIFPVSEVSRRRGLGIP